MTAIITEDLKKFPCGGPARSPQGNKQRGFWIDRITCFYRCALFVVNNIRKSREKVNRKVRIFFMAELVKDKLSNYSFGRPSLYKDIVLEAIQKKEAIKAHTIKEAEGIRKCARNLGYTVNVRGDRIFLSKQ
jgi:hypothetical protein